MLAAPELLEACERLLAWDFFHEAGGMVQEDAEFARAAIAKASGGGIAVVMCNPNMSGT